MDNLLKKIPHLPLPSLTYLDLSNNKIADIESLSHLSSLPNLYTLNLLSNPISLNDPDTYRDVVFGTLKQVHVIDGMDRLGNTVEEEEEEEDDEVRIRFLHFIWKSAPI